MEIHPYQKRAWAEVYVENIQHNYNIVQKAAPKSKICCVVKANAYGHGATQIALIYQQLGADYLAVSNIEEAIQLRNSGINIPILILGYTNPKCAELLSKNDLTQCVFSKSYADMLSQNAVAKNTIVKVHIKIDTGMGRIGFNVRLHSGELSDLNDIENIYHLKGLVADGIFTHFASADDGKQGQLYTKNQFKAFCLVIDYLKSKGIDVGIRHCANSAAIFDYPEMHLDMVRAGIILYGLLPSNKLRCRFELKPALQLVTIIDFIKVIQSGESISYGRDFIAKNKMSVATLPIGYADGFLRSNYKNHAVVEINGNYAPIIGRICMDQCMIDVSNIPDVQIGSKVIVYGLSGENSIDRIASKNQTINYEILCAIGERIPRVFIKGTSILNIQDTIIRGDL